MIHSYQEFEQLCQKPNWREVGSPLARRFARPVGLMISYWIVRLPISAHMVTSAAIVVGLAAAVLLGYGGGVPFALGVTLLLAWYLLDHVDGQVARFKKSASVTGVYLDFLMHHLIHLVVALGWGFGLAREYERLEWVLAGMALGVGWTLLGLSNDCLYKAFYCEMSRTHAVLQTPPLVRVDRTIKRMNVRRFIVESCEIPTVLVLLAVLAAIQLVWPGVGRLDAWYLIVLSVLLPTVALYRVVRQVLCRLPDQVYVEHLRSGGSGGLGGTKSSSGS